MDDNRSSGCLLDQENAADIEVAMHLIGLINGQIESVKAHGSDNPIRACIKITENFLETMTNPFTKKLLQDKMTELKTIHNRP